MIHLNVGDLYDRAVEFYRDRTAIEFNEIRYTYNELGYNALCLANGLRDLGIGKGSKIGLFMKNCPEYLFCEYALAKIGAVRIPLAVLLGAQDHIYMMNQTECDTLIYHESLSDRVQSMIPNLESVKHFICISENPSGVVTGHHRLQTVIEEAKPHKIEERIDIEDLVGIHYTGGTTGKPKGVMLSHRAWVYTVLMEILELGFGWEEAFGYFTPLTHGGGCLILPVLLRKGKCVILDHFSVEHFGMAVERYGITATFLVPTMIYMLLDYPELTEYDLSSLRNIIYGASAIVPERLKAGIEQFGPIFTQLFGQTEAPMILSALSRDEHLVTGDPEGEKARLSSAGRPAFHAEVRIEDDEGNRIARGEPGEIVVKCSNVMSGYFKNPEATKETLKDGWLHTGDIARQDGEGFLYIVDRKKDMIVSGGFNIFPSEIEDVLHEHPAVKSAAVIGVPHEKWGEEIKAIVVLEKGSKVDAQKLIEYVKSIKGSITSPKSVEFWDELPLTNIGKIDKKAIRAKFWKGKDRLVM